MTTILNTIVLKVILTRQFTAISINEKNVKNGFELTVSFVIV